MSAEKVTGAAFRAWRDNTLAELHEMARQAKTTLPSRTLKALGQMHGRTSFEWNGEENTRGRQVWFNAVETAMKSERHFWATLNYIHHNPVKHGYVKRAIDWPHSTIHRYVANGVLPPDWAWVPHEGEFGE